MPSIGGPQHYLVYRRLAQALIGPLVTAAPVLAQGILWIDQFGTPNDDAAVTAVTDSAGGVYVAGYTGKLSSGFPSRRDAVVARYDPRGNRLWLRRFGTDGEESVVVALPGDQGAVRLVGWTTGGYGPAEPGVVTYLLIQYGALGRESGTQILRVDGIPLTGTAGSAGEFFLAGMTIWGGSPDSWIAKFNASAERVWSLRIPFSTDALDQAACVVSDGVGGVYACGWSSVWSDTTLLFDGWLARVDSSGELLWSRQFATPGNDFAGAVVADNFGGVLVGGSTHGSLGGPNNGSSDAWLARFGPEGDQVWIRQYGTYQPETITALASDGSGGSLATMRIHDDVWLQKMDSLGTPYLLSPVAEQVSTVSESIVADDGGGVFACGSTGGSLVGDNAGGDDVWVARHDGVCSPGSTYCTASATSIPGCVASIAGDGVPSLADATGYSFSAGPIPGSNLGICLFGLKGKANNTIGSLGGKLCALSPLYRTAPALSGGTLGECDGSYTFTLGDLINAQPAIASGTTINAQVWARDPANQDGFLLSDAIEFVVCP
jgi:hypothetical protein